MEGCILWASRVIVPVKGRNQLLLELHDGHFGIAKTKGRARSCIWWLGMDKDIEKIVSEYDKYQQTKNSPPESTFQSWPWPSRPWSRLHLDYAGPLNNTMLLVVVDAFSKWVEVFPVTSATSFTTIQKLRTLFAQFGLPDTIVSDNDSCFVSQEFKLFLSENGICQLTSAPYHPATNGLAERMVQMVKNGLKRVTTGTLSERLAKVLFHYRVSPHSSTNVSPAELLFQRKLKSKLDLVRPDISSRIESNQLQRQNSGNKTT